MNIAGWSNEDFDFMGLCTEQVFKLSRDNYPPYSAAIFAIVRACDIDGRIMPPTMMEESTLQAELANRAGKSYGELLAAKGLSPLQITTVMTSCTLGDIEKILAGVKKPLSESAITKAINRQHRAGMKLD